MASSSPAFRRSTIDDVLVLLGKTFSVDAQLKVGDVTEVVQRQRRAEKQIDLRSTTLAHNVTAEEFDRMPKARSFQGIALTSPSVNSARSKAASRSTAPAAPRTRSPSTASSTNSLINGSSRQNTVFEYLQEVQVKTGGIDAEYGGALGGVISAVTKSGGNTFHGEGHYYYDGNGLSAGPVQRLVLEPGRRHDGLPRAGRQAAEQPQRDRRLDRRPDRQGQLFFFGSFSPRFVRRTNDYLFSNGTEPGRFDADADADAGVRQGDLPAQPRAGERQRARDADDVRRARCRPTTAPAPNFITELAGGERADLDPRLRPGPDQHERQRRHHAVERVVPRRVRGGYFYDNYNDTGIPTTTQLHLPDARRSASPACPPNLQRPDRHAEHAARA